MSFRPATMGDAELLYEWRVEAEGRGHWEGKPVHPNAHRSWLESRIENPLVHVWMWEPNDDPIGMVRIDSNGELAFHGSSRMVRAAAAKYGLRLKATVDAGDERAWRTLQRAGFTEYPVRFLAYKS